MGVLPSSPGNVVQCFVTNKMLSEVSVDEAYAVFSNHIINFWGFCPPPPQSHTGAPPQCTMMGDFRSPDPLICHRWKKFYGRPGDLVPYKIC